MNFHVPMEEVPRNGIKKSNHVEVFEQLIMCLLLRLDPLSMAMLDNKASIFIPAVTLCARICRLSTQFYRHPGR